MPAPDDPLMLDSEALDAQDDTWDELNRDAEGEEPDGSWLLGLPVRLVHDLAASGVPLLAVGLFSVLHDWPPPPACPAFAIFGRPSAPFPVGVQALDWLYMAGPYWGLRPPSLRAADEESPARAASWQCR